MKKAGRGSFLVIACLMAAAVAPAAFGGEGMHYPNGAEDSLSGMAPPPGWHIVNYLLYYDSDTMKTPGGDVDIDLKLWAEVLRVIYSSDKKILGGNYLAHIFIPYIDADLDPFGYSAHGIADPIIDPFIIAWHGQTYHAVAGLDIYVPVGEYDEESPINLIGKNFWTFEPAVAVTGLYKSGFSWSLKMMYDFNTKNDEYFNPGPPEGGAPPDDIIFSGSEGKSLNHEAGFKSELEPGDEFHVDYAFDYGVAKNCRLGVCGYYYKQLENDEIDDVEVPGKGEAFAVGPVFMYSPLKNLHLVAKAQFEVKAENKSEGNAYWLKVIYSF